MAFRKVHYTISNSHPKLVVKNYFSNITAQKFKVFSTTFKNLPGFQALSRALNFKNRNQALSRIFQALHYLCANLTNITAMKQLCYVNYKCNIFGWFQFRLTAAKGQQRVYADQMVARYVTHQRCR